MMHQTNISIPDLSQDSWMAIAPMDQKIIDLPLYFLGKQFGLSTIHEPYDKLTQVLAEFLLVYAPYLFEQELSHGPGGHNLNQELLNKRWAFLHQFFHKQLDSLIKIITTFLYKPLVRDAHDTENMAARVHAELLVPLNTALTSLCVRVIALPAESWNDSHRAAFSITPEVTILRYKLNQKIGGFLAMTAYLNAGMHAVPQFDCRSGFLPLAKNPPQPHASFWDPLNSAAVISASPAYYLNQHCSFERNGRPLHYQQDAPDDGGGRSIVLKR
ncbi:MAG: hypothetical protein V4490_04520 [Pseudomonadota bacterium]